MWDDILIYFMFYEYHLISIFAFFNSFVCKFIREWNWMDWQNLLFLIVGNPNILYFILTFGGISSQFMWKFCDFVVAIGKLYEVTSTCDLVAHRTIGDDILIFVFSFFNMWDDILIYSMFYEYHLISIFSFFNSFIWKFIREWNEMIIREWKRMEYI